MERQANPGRAGIRHRLDRRYAYAGGALVVLAFALGFALPDDDEVVYLTAPAERGDISAVVTATGTVAPVDQVNVGSQISGQILDVFVDFNDEVARGDRLARIDPESFEAVVMEAEAALESTEATMLMQEAALKRAEAELGTARASQDVRSAETENMRAQREEAARQLERFEALEREAVISGSDVDRAQAAADSAAALLRAAETQEVVGSAATQSAEAAVTMAIAGLQNALAEVKRRSAALDRARVDLERTLIRSPIDGVVINRSIESGQTVAASLEAPTLFTLASDLARMEVYAQVDQADIGRVRLGQHVTFTVDAYPETVFEGTVEQIRKAPQVVQNVVTYTVVVSAENPSSLLLPGMTAVLRIVVTSVSNALRVPGAALRFRPEARIAVPAEAAARAGALGTPNAGTPTLIWVLDDGELVPRVVGYAPGDASVTAIVGGDLWEGERVVVGSTTAGDAAVGLRLGQ